MLRSHVTAGLGALGASLLIVAGIVSCVVWSQSSTTAEAVSAREARFVKVKGPVESLTHRTYAVSGRTVDDLRQQMWRWGPGGFWGHATWRLTWPVEMGGDGSFCTVVAGEVRLDLRLRTPRLSWIGGPRDCVRESFDLMNHALLVHEMGHVELAREGAREVVAALNALRPEADCAAMQLSADRTARAILGAMNDRQRLYDIRTRHGATQGVEFAACPDAMAEGVAGGR